MKRKVLGVLSRWVFANAILPILVPVLILVGGDWFFADHINVSESLTKLVYEGFYIFSAMTLVFSLFEDYAIFQSVVKPLAGMLLMIPMLGTCIIFYATEKYGVSYFSSHIIQFLCMWVVLAIYSTFLKYRIVNYKQKYKY